MKAWNVYAAGVLVATVMAPDDLPADKVRAGVVYDITVGLDLDVQETGSAPQATPRGRHRAGASESERVDVDWGSVIPYLRA